MILLNCVILFLLIKASVFARLNRHGYMQSYSVSITNIPYHLVIVYGKLYCSGTLLRSRVVVTAASCFQSWTDEKVVVKVGANTITGLGQVIEVDYVKMHEYFGHTSELDNDIALLHLKEHVIFRPNVKKILLIEANTVLKAGIPLEVSGWASVELSQKYANSLLRSEMTVVSNSECKGQYPFLASESNFCAKYFQERRLCDNGGPATTADKLAGILSYWACGDQPHVLAILTNVSYFHKWIDLNIKRFMTNECKSHNNVNYLDV